MTVFFESWYRKANGAGVRARARAFRTCVEKCGVKFSPLRFPSIDWYISEKSTGRADGYLWLFLVLVCRRQHSGNGAFTTKGSNFDEIGSY